MRLQHHNLKSKYKSQFCQIVCHKDTCHEPPLELCRTKLNCNSLIMVRGTMNKLKIINNDEQMHKKWDIRNLTVASKDIQLQKKSTTQKCPWSSSTAPLQSSAFHADVHNMPWAPYRRVLLPSTGDKHNCSMQNIQSVRPPSNTLFTSMTGKHKINQEFLLKRTVLMICLESYRMEATIIKCHKNDLVSYLSLFSPAGSEHYWFPYINECTETRVRPHAKVIHNMSSKAAPYPAGHS